eukprot:scaffold7647_cov403-Prasinococcus_capsulatus_cf.AAC.7
MRLKVNRVCQHTLYDTALVSSGIACVNFAIQALRTGDSGVLGCNDSGVTALSEEQRTVRQELVKRSLCLPCAYLQQGSDCCEPWPVIFPSLCRAVPSDASLG